MATTEEINRLVSTLLDRTGAIYDLIALYLDRDTTPEQRSDIRARVQPLQPRIRFGNQDRFTLEERIRIHVGRMSLFDGVEPEEIDSRDAQAAFQRFVETVIDPAIRAKVPILKIIEAIKQISTHQANAKIASFEEFCRYRAQKVYKEDAERWRQAQSGEQPEQKQGAPASKPGASRPKTKSMGKVERFLRSQYSDDANLPHHHWVSPMFRFSVTAILVSIIALIVILQGEDPRSVIVSTVIFLAIFAVLCWTYFNRDWGK